MSNATKSYYRSMGWCTWCGSPDTPTKADGTRKSLCQPCMDGYLAREKQRYDRNKTNGVCAYCAKPVHKGVLCRKCVQSHRKAYDGFKVAGRCVYCGGVRNNKKYLKCEKCRGISNDYSLIRRLSLIDEGICALCGRNQITDPYRYCDPCRARRRFWRKEWKRRKKNGEH